MKSNSMLLVALLLFSGFASFACNSCSQVSIANNATYLMQNTLSDYVSLQGQCASFHSQNIESVQSNDNLFSTELLLKKGVNKQIYIWSALPMRFNIRRVDHNQLRNIGLGDIRFGIDYRFRSITVGSVQLVPILSGGVKTPTGHYEHYLPSQGMPRSFNLGTGSWGVSINPMLMLQYKKWGALLSGLYFTNRANKYDYQYGSQSSLSANLYYAIYSKGVTQVLPSLGLMLDKVANDSYQDNTQKQTGGQSTLLQFGLSAQTNRHSFSFEYRKPIRQEYAQNSVALRDIYTARYTFLLKKQTTKRVEKLLNN